jgi:hypothetical protein
VRVASQEPWGQLPVIVVRVASPGRWGRPPMIVVLGALQALLDQSLMMYAQVA